MVLDFIGTWLGLGLGGFGTKGLGTGLDNYEILHTWWVAYSILVSAPVPFGFRSYWDLVGTWVQNCKTVLKRGPVVSNMAN